MGATSLLNVLPLRSINTCSETPSATSDETKCARVGRPRKYTSAAERQAAYRARNDGIVTWRLGEVPAKIAEIAAQVDLPANELAYQMLKFALANRNWREEQMFGKPLPNAATKVKVRKL